MANNTTSPRSALRSLFTRIVIAFAAREADTGVDQPITVYAAVWAHGLPRSRLCPRCRHHDHGRLRHLLRDPRRRQFRQLPEHGALPPRVLWASTRTKHPALPNTYHVGRPAAPGTVDTVCEKTLLAHAHHRVTCDLMEPDHTEAGRRIQRGMGGPTRLDPSETHPTELSTGD
jgi:hypothetical protein